LKGLGRIHVLDRYEIENYLLNPAGLAAYVCSRKGNQRTETPDEEAIRKGLDAAASRCWAVIAAKRTRDLLKQHLSSLLSGLDRAEEDVRDDLLKLCEDGNLPDLERHSAAVDRWREEIQNIEWRGPEEMADWACDDLSYELGEVERRVQDADWALTNAPGSIILDTVLRDFGISYRKRRDARRLAECMPDEHWQTGDGAELREIVESLLNPDQEVSDANP